MRNSEQKKKKIMFLIHDLSIGGAEKVLVNLVNHMDQNKYDITVMALFGGGVNEQFLNQNITYRYAFKHAVRGNSHYMKLFSPRQLYRWLVPESYDIVISYLEGPTARIVSGCQDKDTKLVSWIHIEQNTKKTAARSFRNFEESKRCYGKFDRIICVSDTVRKDFCSIYNIDHPVEVLYNTNESEEIKKKAAIPLSEQVFSKEEINLIGVGKIVPKKGFDRMARILKRLRDDGYPVHWYALGIGSEKEKIEQYLKQNQLQEYFTFLGYQTNPYQYVAKADLFVCASYAEGFSTAATEALIVGTPVCTVEVSGMKEMLGEKNEWGIVTDNSEEALYYGIRELLEHPEKLTHYKEKAIERGKCFSTEETVCAVEKMLGEL